MSNETLITEIDRLEEYADRNCDLSHCVVQGLDLREQSSCLGSERYVDETGLYPLLQKLAEGREYANLLHLNDDPDEVVDFISAYELETLL